MLAPEDELKDPKQLRSHTSGRRPFFNLNTLIYTKYEVVYLRRKTIRYIRQSEVIYFVVSWIFEKYFLNIYID